jgi:hypothetical protein
MSFDPSLSNSLVELAARIRGIDHAIAAGELLIEAKAARSNFRRAKTDLIAEKRFIEADKQFWRLSKSQPESPPF